MCFCFRKENHLHPFEQTQVIALLPDKTVRRNPRVDPKPKWFRGNFSQWKRLDLGVYLTPLGEPDLDEEANVVLDTPIAEGDEDEEEARLFRCSQR